MSLTAGTALVNPVTAGTGAARISGALAYKQATGGADTISWSESIAAPWAELLLEIPGAALEGIIHPVGVLPQVW